MTVKKNFLDILVCPVCKGSLTYHEDTQELWCLSSRLAFPIKDGIPIMLETEARTLTDLECHR